jgi:uncharacterized protein YycO
MITYASREYLKVKRKYREDDDLVLEFEDISMDNPFEASTLVRNTIWDNQELQAFDYFIVNYKGHKIKLDKTCTSLLWAKYMKIVGPEAIEGYQRPTALQEV